MREDIKLDVETEKKIVEEYFGKIEEEKKRVSSSEYINWIYDFVSVNKSADDEGALYVYEGINAENGKLLGAFLDYVKTIAPKQRVAITTDDECRFDNEQVAIKIKDRYFKIFRMFGQGSWTSVVLLEEEPDYACVKLLK